MVIDSYVGILILNGKRGEKNLMVGSLVGWSDGGRRAEKGGGEERGVGEGIFKLRERVEAQRGKMGEQKKKKERKVRKRMEEWNGREGIYLRSSGF